MYYGSKWCRMAQVASDGAEWRKMAQNDAEWRKRTLSKAG